MTPTQYAEEIVWPMIALKRLASAAVEPVLSTQNSVQPQRNPASGP